MSSPRLIASVACVPFVTGMVGCAQITTTHHVSVLEKRGAEPVVLGPPQGQVTKRGVDLSWAQDGDALVVTLTETRLCAAVRHEPVVRVDKIERKTGGALYWEYGLAGATLGLGLTALIRPDLFSQASVNSDGDLVKDLRSGYRIGGIFTAIGTAFLVAGIYDTVRARDETVYVDAYRVHRGEETACEVAAVPLDGQDVELIVGEWRAEEAADADGTVRFTLPSLEELGVTVPEPEDGAVDDTTPDAADDDTTPDDADDDAAPDDATPPAEGEVTEPAPAPPPAPAEIKKGVLRIDVQRATAIDFVVPYDHPDATRHTGEISIEPIHLGKDAAPPPKPAE